MPISRVRVGDTVFYAIVKYEMLFKTGEKLYIRKVTTTSLLKACRRLLKQDPVSNVLPLGDLYMPLIRVSNIYSAIKGRQVVGVYTVYRAFQTPSVVLGTAEQEVKRALVKQALGEIPDKFISLCQPDEVTVFSEYSAILHSHLEHQMIANPPNQIESRDVEAVRVKMNELGSLDRFYAEHNAEAWTPIQFEVGPYYCVKQDSKIVSAAGVHLVTPQIAQLGNIITDEDYRNRGFATACTNALVKDLASRDRIISLFVRTDNAPAIHVYEKLGFFRKRDINFLIMRKENVRRVS